LSEGNNHLAPSGRGAINVGVVYCRHSRKPLQNEGQDPLLEAPWPPKIPVEKAVAAKAYSAHHRSAILRSKIKSVVVFPKLQQNIMLGF